MIFNMVGGKPLALPTLDSNYPQDATVMKNTSVSFEVVIETEGTPAIYTYQWYVNDNAVSDATGSTYTYVPTEIGTTTVYCKVTNAAGTVQSRPATLTVTPLYILKDGVVQSTITGFRGYTGNGTHTPAISFDTPEQMTVTIAPRSDGNSGGYVETTSAINLSGFTKMNVSVKLSYAISADVESSVGVTKTLGSSSVDAYTNLAHSTEKQTVTVDLSSLSGSNVYFLSRIRGHDTNVGNTYAFYDIWFE